MVVFLAVLVSLEFLKESVVSVIAVPGIFFMSRFEVSCLHSSTCNFDGCALGIP